MNITPKAQKSLQRILEAFEKGSIPKALSRTIIPALDVPSSQWSLNNRLLAFLAGTEDARGMRQWNKVGRHVLTGRKAVYILAPLLVNKKEKTDAEKFLIGFRAIPVFCAEDTDGDPLDYSPITPLAPPPLTEVAEQWGLTISYTAIIQGRYGSYAPRTKQITLCTHDEDVFFHELAHAAHERVKGALKTTQDWQQEILAELTAATLVHLYGRQPNDGRAFQYIAGYAKKAGMDPHRACLAVLTDVEQCLAEILADTAVPALAA